MAVLEYVRGSLDSLGLVSSLLIIPCLILAGHFIYFIIDPHCIRSYPGPLLAKLSDAWLGYVAAHGHRSEVVHGLHQQYGECFVGLRGSWGEGDDPLRSHQPAVRSVAALAE